MGDLRSSKREQLRPFGPVWDGAGIRGFAKEGYWYHAYRPGLARALARSTFVTKTITTDRMKGHMELDASYRPVSLFPDCIYLNFLRGYALNSVGLSGPGIRKILADTPLRKIYEPFFISYAPVIATSTNTAEVQEFIECIEEWMLSGELRTPHLGIQLNLSCPNVGADLNHFALEAGAMLDLFTPLRLPVVVKLNLLVSPEAAARIAAHPTCTGLCISNSIPFGAVLPKWWWDAHFRKGSPLPERYGKGALSGAPLFRHVLSWLRRFRELDKYTYVNAGGGILRAHDVKLLHHFGADSISFSAVMMLRPWRIGSIVRQGHRSAKT